MVVEVNASLKGVSTRNQFRGFAVLSRHSVLSSGILMNTDITVAKI